MNNIVFVNFECNESTKVVAQKIWQYDYGQILRIQGLNLPAAVEIHFSLQKTGGVAERRIGVTKDRVTDVVIPDFVLKGEGIERNYSAYAFIYLSDEESGQTEHRIELNIISRPEPEGSTGSDETNFGAIMDAVNKIAEQSGQGVSDEKIQEAVNAYMEANPVEGNVTVDTELSETSTNPVANSTVTKKFSQLSDTVNDLKGSEVSGISVELTSALVNYYTHVMPNFDDANGLSYVNAILTALGAEIRGEGNSSGNTEVTLTSISATYSGGSVLVGTSVNDLTGIVVTATYSDGSTANVTDYTLSGTIAEGNNTITVSYGGKTTTITVTGVAESGGGNTPVEMTKYGEYDWINGNEYSDNGTTAYSGRVGDSRGLLWCSEVFAEDTEVSVSILYGTTNANLRQYCACVSSEYTLNNGAYALNTPDLHYLTQIGTASTTEYTATYTVRAGYRLAIINYNSGIPQSMTVTA